MSAGGKYDVVWLLGHGSRVDNWEIRHSMRSFGEHFRDLGRMWIIGASPEWIDPDLVRVIRFPDSHRVIKDANLIAKLLWLSGEPDLSEEFILCSDDQFLLRSAGWEDFRAWHCGDLAQKKWPARTGGWLKRLRNTGRWLRAHGYRALHCDAHIPYPVAKRAARDLLRTPYAAPPGLTIFTTYFNLAAIHHPGLHELAPIAAEPVRAGIYGADSDPAATAEKLACNLFCSADAGTPNDRFFVAEMERKFAKAGEWELDGGCGPLFTEGSQPAGAPAAETLPARRRMRAFFQFGRKAI